MKKNLFYGHTMLEDHEIWPQPLFWLSCITYIYTLVKFNYLILSCSYHSHFCLMSFLVFF